MARFCSLYSGSSGNCIYVEDGDDGVLIDAGVSMRRICAGLQAVGSDITRVRAVFLTHEHSDHIKALPMLFKKYEIPVFATPGTVRGACAAVEGLVPARFEQMETGCCAEVGGMAISSFATSHDSLESVGYRISFAGGENAAVATDLGFVDEPVMHGVQGCKMVMLESNHDIDMLRNGRYPYYLKRRILSAMGHLSNRDCAAVLPALAGTGMRHVVLAHLSADNNLPALALETATEALCAAGLQDMVSVETAPRSGPGHVYTL